jgi:glycerol-3-phosphate acyltransferase PlsY
VSLGSIVAAIGFLAYILVSEQRAGWPAKAMIIFACLIAGLVIIRHRSNIQRLLAGTENKIGMRDKR